MSYEWKRQMQRATLQGATLVLAGSLSGTVSVSSSQQAKGGMDTATTDAQGRFYCNIKALTPAQRIRHKELGERMAAARTATVETEKGYEFQYSPEKISVGEVAEWVVAESKCCPFFDFHIDLEEGGRLICLRLTGSEGVKSFIRSEFHI